MGVSGAPLELTPQDVERARAAWWQGDLRVAQGLLVEHPEHVHALIAVRSPLDVQPWDAGLRRRLFTEALRGISPTPALRPALVALAFEPGREAREIAQALLAEDPPVDEVLAAVHSGDKDVRAVAATWLAKLRVVSAIPALTAAFRREKVAATQAAQLRALAGLGVPVGVFLDRASQARDAEALVAKSAAVREKIAFLEPDTLPDVRFVDGAPVPRVVVLGWLVAAHKTKSPVASPLLTALAAELAPDEREALGAAIFDRWMALELELPPDLPLAVVEVLTEWAERRGLTLERFAREPDFKSLLGWAYSVQGETASERPNPLDHRGVLAVAAALAPRTLVPTFVREIKRFRGLRIGVSRALLLALSGMEDRAATQALIGFSMRFRTASLRKEAERLVEELAATRGWTPEELAERMIPTGGLDERGVLALAYVEADPASSDEDDRPATRRFEARLQGDGALALVERTADGASVPLAKLPEPRQAEDAAQAAAEKKRLAAARKEVQATFATQRERLFGAMCSERRIRLDDVAAHLAHPLMRVLLQRVVLLAWDADGARIGPCRLTEDGTFATSTDDRLELPPDAAISVAHASGLTPDERAALRTLLDDYFVIPLFPQLDRALYPLGAAGAPRLAPPGGPASVSSFTLRGRLKRLGWERGPSGDGGYVDRYVRRVVSLGLEAALVHTPVPQPESDTRIVVEGVEVRRVGAPAPLVVEAIPAVLRHELWNDLLEAIGG